jgi:hypothetical protein
MTTPTRSRSATLRRSAGRLRHEGYHDLADLITAIAVAYDGACRADVASLDESSRWTPVVARALAFADD